MSRSRNRRREIRRKKQNAKHVGDMLLSKRVRADLLSIPDVRYTVVNLREVF